MKIRYIQKTENSPIIISIDDFFEYLKIENVLQEGSARKYKWELKAECIKDLLRDYSRGSVTNNPLVIIDPLNTFASWTSFLVNIRIVVKKDKQLTENAKYKELLFLIDNELRDNGYSVSKLFAKTILAEAAIEKAS